MLPVGKVTNGVTVRSKTNLSGEGQPEVKLLVQPVLCHSRGRLFQLKGHLYLSDLLRSDYAIFFMSPSIIQWNTCPVSEVLLTSWELWRGEPSEQDSSALYQRQQDTSHGCRAYHGYWSIYRGTGNVNISHTHTHSTLASTFYTGWDATEC